MSALCIECSAALTPDRTESFWCGLADERHSYLLAATIPSPSHIGPTAQTDAPLAECGEGRGYGDL